MSNPEDLEEFEEQLRLLEEEKRKKEKEEEKAQSKPKTYVDDDGTTFEWDESKNAFFPKIDDDFVLQYQQASYSSGSSEQEQQQCSGSREEMYDRFYAAYEAYRSSGQQEPLMGYEEYYKWWFYQQYSTTAANAATGTDTDNNTTPTDTDTDTGATDAASGDTTDESTLGKKRPGQPQQPPSWFDADESKNTNVYVSNLPSDINEEEFVEIMSKYGIIMNDPDSKKVKVKLYKDAEGNYKGDGLCCYLKIESVKLCLQLLQDYEIRGRKLTVAQAQFQLKGEYNPALKKRKKMEQSKKKKKGKNVVGVSGQDKLLDWKPEPIQGAGGRKRNERVIVIKNMFDPKEFEKDPTLILEYQRDVREECNTKFGEVRKVMVYDLHPEGVVTVTFKEAEAADLCLENFHGRYFASRQLSAAQWDGRTSYMVEESGEERDARISKWHQEIERDD